MNFKQFLTVLQNQFQNMVQYNLYRLDVSGDDIWDAYINGFDAKDNPIFRDPNSSYHNCNNDKNYIRRYGNIVAINDNFEIVSMFDVLSEVEGTGYENSIKKIQSLISKAKVKDIFFETFNELNSLPYQKINKTQDVYQLGHIKTLKKYTKEEADKYGRVNTEDIYTFNHFHNFLPTRFVDKSGKSVEQVMAEFRDAKNVFKRGLDEIPLDTLLLVRDLINQGSLLNSLPYVEKVHKFIEFKKQYDNTPSDKKDNWAWVKSHSNPFSRFNNELIGTLCNELAQGMELNAACLAWNKRADPANFMKAKAPITENQKQATAKYMEENGYMGSLIRRLATINDINVSEILHINNDVVLKNASVFDSLKTAPPTRHKKSEFDKLEEVGIEKFMKDILPTCTSIEVLFTKKHLDNLVTLTTAVDKDSKSMFKWDNQFSWTYKGNLAGRSFIKDAVKDAGGVVDAILRGSMIWNELGNDQSDLDLWCVQPDGISIGFNSGYRKDRGDNKTSLGGQLDLDNTNPGTKIGIENIYFNEPSKLKVGTYKFFVNQYSDRGSKGFKFEIEVDGEIYNYEYNKPISSGKNVNVAEITYKKDGTFEIKHHLEPTDGFYKTETHWNLETNKFHKVNLVCLSPNYWKENNVGNLHYMFFIPDAKCEDEIRTFHSENLKSELLPHRAVLDYLGNAIAVKGDEKQLSGLGFNSTHRDELIVKLQGTHKRMIKIKF